MNMRALRHSTTAFLFLLFLLLNCTGETDRHLYYDEAGSGETILFIHGSQEDYRVFIPQLNALKETYRAVTYSRRYNYPNNNKYRKETAFDVFTEAEDLASLMDELNIDSAHLVGHSYGGLVGLAYANEHPERVISLILSEPPLLKLPGCESWHDQAQTELIQKGKAAFKTEDSTKVMSAIFEFFVGTDIQDQVPPEVLQSLYANLSEMEALVHSENPFPELSTDIEPPMMLLTAGNTMPMLECTNKVLIQLLPQAKHFHLPDATHNMWMTHSEQLSGVIHAFISGR